MVRVVDLIRIRPPGAAAAAIVPRDAVPEETPAQTRPLPWLLGLGVALVVTLVYHYSVPGESPFDQYRRLADALLDGRVYVTEAPGYIELTRWGGRYYVIPPPFPALLMAPFIALFGAAASQSLLLGAFAGGLHAMVVLFIVSRMVQRRGDQWWLVVLFTFGTIIWFMAAGGSTWFAAHVIAALALSVALLETLGAKRPLIIGAAIAAAFWTRLPSVLTLPFFLIMTLDQWAPHGLRRWRTIRLSYLNALLAPIAIVTLLNFGYNWLRFGTIADVAFRLRNNVPNEWWFERGLFHVSYIPRHIVTMLWSLPVLRPEFPYIVWSMGGLAIWITTPALIFALFAPIRARSTWAAWAGILPTLLALMTFGNTGMVQFGYRFAADFHPLLYFLTIRGMGSPLRPIHKIAIGLAVVVNLWGVIWEGMEWRAL